MERICDFMSRFEIGDWIALLGVLLTGVFSFLLWKTTRKIGKRQNELQENQNKIASNQIYRKLYACLNDVQTTCDWFPYYLENSIFEIVSGSKLVFCIEYIDEINRLKNKVNICEIDINLQLTKYPQLYSNIILLLTNMGMAYSEIKRLKMPSTSDKMDIMNVDTLKTMIKTLKKDNPNYNVDIDNITNKEYTDVLRKTTAILYKSKWEIKDYFRNSYEDRINYISERLSMLNENNYIEEYCKNIIYYRRQIFEQKNGALDFVKEKCKLQ